MLQTFSRPALVKGNLDCFAVCDLPGFATLAESVPADDDNRERCTSNASWSGRKSYDTSLQQVRTGDLSGVPASDKIMSDIEADAFLSQVWRVRHDVVGGVPNVPAYLAGHPLNMRRRERQLSEQGPLTVFASLELSACIDVQTMRKRGAAILAMVRILSNSRPVTLYACCGVGETGFGSHVLIRLDTAPLDLARVAHVLTDPSVTRGLCYGSARTVGLKYGKHWFGNWAYANADKYRRVARDAYMRATDTQGEAVLLPAAHSNDPCVTQPTVWLKSMVAKFGGGLIEE